MSFHSSLAARLGDAWAKVDHNNPNLSHGVGKRSKEQPFLRALLECQRDAHREELDWKINDFCRFPNGWAATANSPPPKHSPTPMLQYYCWAQECMNLDLF